MKPIKAPWFLPALGQQAREKSRSTVLPFRGQVARLDLCGERLLQQRRSLESDPIHMPRTKSGWDGTGQITRPMKTRAAL